MTKGQGPHRTFNTVWSRPAGQMSRPVDNPMSTGAQRRADKKGVTKKSRQYEATVIEEQQR